MAWSAVPHPSAHPREPGSDVGRDCPWLFPVVAAQPTVQQKAVHLTGCLSQWLEGAGGWTGRTDGSTQELGVRAGQGGEMGSHSQTRQEQPQRRWGRMSMEALKVQTL